MKNIYKIAILLFLPVLQSCSTVKYNPANDPSYDRARSLYYQSIKSTSGEEKLKMRSEIIRISPESEYGLFSRAWIKEKEESYKAALALYDEAIRMNGREHVFYYNRALLLMKHYTITGTVESLRLAQDDLDRCIQLDSSCGNAYFSRAEIKSIRKDYSGAITDYSSALKFNPSDSETYYNRGLIKLNTKDYKGAKSDADMAIKLNREFAAAYCLRGMAFYYLDRKSEACRDYRKAGSIDPDSCIFGGNDGIINNCGD